MAGQAPEEATPNPAVHESSPVGRMFSWVFSIGGLFIVYAVLASLAAGILLLTGTTGSGVGQLAFRLLCATSLLSAIISIGSARY